MLPLQPPDALHEVALVDDHVSCVLPPLDTLVGLAPRLTVGDGNVTATTTASDAVPPSPLHASVNVVSAVSAPVLSDPDVALLPLQPPDAMHEPALVLDHDNVVDVPDKMDAAAAVMSTVGAGKPLLSSEDEQPAAKPRIANSAPVRLSARTPPRSMRCTTDPRNALSARPGQHRRHPMHSATRNQ